MVYNSALANSMLTFCKNVNAPEIMQAVEREQGAAAGPARTTRRWLRDMAEPKSMIDPELPVEHDYNFWVVCRRNCTSQHRSTMQAQWTSHQLPRLV